MASQDKLDFQPRLSRQRSAQTAPSSSDTSSRHLDLSSASLNLKSAQTVSFNKSTFRPASTRTPKARFNMSKSRSGVRKTKIEADLHAKFLKNVIAGIQRETNSPNKQILDLVTSDGALTESGRIIIEKNLWDFEVGYADSGSGVDAFCRCTSKESHNWIKSIGETPKENIMRPGIPILLRLFFESFTDLFAEKRYLMAQGLWWDKSYTIESISSEMQQKFFANAKIDFADALWGHFLTEFRSEKVQT